MMERLVGPAIFLGLLAAVYECGRLRHRAAVPKLIAFLDSKTPALATEAA